MFRASDVWIPRIRTAGIIFASLALLSGCFMLLGIFTGQHILHTVSGTAGSTLLTGIMTLASSAMTLAYLLGFCYDENRIKGCVLFGISMVSFIVLGSFFGWIDAIDMYARQTFYPEYDIRTSEYTQLLFCFAGLGFILLNFGRMAESMVFPYMIFSMPLVLLYDSLFWDEYTLGYASYHTLFALMFLGLGMFFSVITSRNMYRLVRGAILTKEFIKYCIYGLVYPIVLVTGYQLSFLGDRLVLYIILSLLLYQYFVFKVAEESAESLLESEQETEKYFMASLTDKLTGAYNRHGLEYILRRYHENGDTVLGIIMFDIDDFKYVNDKYGHLVGDEVLCTISNAIKDAIRADDVLIRWGGEEFLVLTRTDTLHETHRIAEKIQRAVWEITFSDNLKINLSLGVSMVSNTMEEFVNVEDFVLSDLDGGILHADKALLYAKRTGKNKIVIADEEFSKNVLNSGMFVSYKEIEDGLKNKEFYFVYQPVINTHTKTVVGLEMLIRWKRDKADIEYSPEVFADKLVELSLMKPETVGVELVRLMALYFTMVKDILPETYVSVNFNLDQLVDDTIVDEIYRLLLLANSYKRQIVIELLENNAKINLKNKKLFKNLSHLKKHGALIALDDYGKNDSNVIRLVSLPVDMIKFDRELSQTILVDGDEVDLKTKAILENLREIFVFSGVRHVVVEGVETLDEAKAFDDMGMVLHQGWLYSRAVTSEELHNSVKKLGDKYNINYVFRAEK